MRKFRSQLAMVVILLTQFGFVSNAVAAQDSDEVTFTQCEMIAKTCLAAGYTRGGAPGKAFWHDCMKPILLGQTVMNVNVDSKDAMACKQFKITKLQSELQDLQSK